MKKDKKVYIKRALIVFPIILVLAGTTLLGALAAFTDDSPPVQQQNQAAMEDIEKLLDNENALTILDIHENLDSYLDQDVSLEGNFVTYNDNIDVFGVEISLGDEKVTIASMPYELNDDKILDDAKDSDLVKATGTIESFKQEDKELPKFIIKEIQVVK